MQATIRYQGPVAVVDLVGRLVYGDGDTELIEAIKSLLDGGTVSIVLNMEGLGFMDSAGLVALITCHKRVATRGGALRILRPTRRASDLLAITRLSAVFQVHVDEAAAVRSFQASR